MTGLVTCPPRPATDVVAFYLFQETVKRNGWFHSNKLFYRLSILEAHRKYINGEIQVIIFPFFCLDQIHIWIFFLHKLFLNSYIMINFTNKIHFVEVSITV